MKRKTVGYIVKCEGSVCCLGRGDQAGALLYGRVAELFKNRRACTNAIQTSYRYDVNLKNNMPGYTVRPVGSYEILRVAVTQS